jgi:serine/threonine protein kinase/Tfp pilus assembly protein PilF
LSSPLVDEGMEDNGPMIDKTISHYKILEKLGEGGMGVVYKAQDTKLDRIVALKFLPKHLLCDNEAKTRFEHEAKAASALDHPNIATIYEIDEAEGECFISMAYVEGKSIKELLKEKNFTIEEILSIAIQIAEGLNSAHKKGIVHRDIKSDNLMLTDEGSVKIMDFGLAKLKGVPGLTKTGSTVGTLAYMSPEQAQGMELDQRSDIFSFGVVLYEMITGQLPFKGEHEAAIIYSILNEAPEPLEMYKANVPEGLQKVINKALEKNREIRYQQMDELRADLKKLPREIESPVKKQLPSIAVLPFTNLSADKEQDYFCDGMAEEVINALSQIEDLRVVARTSAFAFKDKHEDIREIGRKLNVENLLEGSVRKSGNRLRITAQLINVSDGYHLWSERFDRDLADVFAIQDEISLAIVDKLKVKLLGDEKKKLLKRYTQNLEAYDLYLKGRYHWNRRTPESLRKAMIYFEQVIQKDPNYALAYAGLADCYSMLAQVYVLAPKEAFPKAKALAKKALEIDETLAEAHTSLAFVLSIFDWDWANAGSEYRRAIELNPNYATAHQWFAKDLVSIGRKSEAIQEVYKSLEIDPLSLIINLGAGYVYLDAGYEDKAIEQAEKILDMDPAFGFAHLLLAEVNQRRGKYDEAVQEYLKGLCFGELLSEQEVVILREAYASSGWTGYLRSLVEITQSRIERGQVIYYEMARLYSLLDDTDKAIEYLEKAYEEHDYNLSDLLMNDDFAKLYSNPRFVQLIKKMGFPQ